MNPNTASGVARSCAEAEDALSPHFHPVRVMVEVDGEMHRRHEHAKEAFGRPHGVLYQIYCAGKLRATARGANALKRVTAQIAREAEARRPKCDCFYCSRLHPRPEQPAPTSCERKPRVPDGIRIRDDSYPPPGYKAVYGGKLKNWEAQKLVKDFREAYPAISEAFWADDTDEEIAARNPTVEQQAATLGLVRVVRDGAELTALLPGQQMAVPTPIGDVVVRAYPNAKPSTIVLTENGFSFYDTVQYGSDL